MCAALPIGVEQRKKFMQNEQKFRRAKKGGFMDIVINFICGDSEVFTPQVVCGLILFCSIFETIGNIAYNLTSVGKGR